MLLSICNNIVLILSTYEISASIYEVCAGKNTLEKLPEANLSTNVITMKTQLETNEILRVKEKSFFKQ